MNAQPLTEDELQYIEGFLAGERRVHGDDLSGKNAYFGAKMMPHLVATIRALQAEASARMIPLEGTVK